MAEKTTIFDNINGELRRRHLTQQDLAKTIEIDRRTWPKWQDKNDMPASVLLQIAKWLNVTLDYLTRDVHAE